MDVTSRRTTVRVVVRQVDDLIRLSETAGTEQVTSRLCAVRRELGRLLYEWPDDQRGGVMDEVRIEFFTNTTVKAYLDQLAKSGLYGRTVAEAVERIVTGTIEDMVVSGQLEEIKKEGA